MIAKRPRASTVSTATLPPASQHFETRRLRRITLRPVQRDDWLRMGRFYRALSGTSLRRRFHCAISAVGSLGESRVRAMTMQLMALECRGMVLVATTCDASGVETVVAHAGWVMTEADTAEFALVVADDYQREGIGTAMMQALIEGARRRRVGWLKATVIEGNAGMVQLMRHCGLWCASTPDEDGLIDVQGVVAQLPATSRPCAAPAGMRATLLHRCRRWFERAPEAAA